MDQFSQHFFQNGEKALFTFIAFSAEIATLDSYNFGVNITVSANAAFQKKSFPVHFDRYPSNIDKKLSTYNVSPLILGRNVWYILVS